MAHGTGLCTVINVHIHEYMPESCLQSLLGWDL